VAVAIFNPHEIRRIETALPTAAHASGSYAPEEEVMIRTAILCFALALISCPTAALAYSGSPQEQVACRRDVVKLCRSVAGRDEFTILACLQGHRPKLTASCRGVLESHGQ
jgi:hypothetical protein